MEKEKKVPYEADGFKMGDVEIKESPVHGRGVFAAKDIEPKEVIEACPVISFKRKGKRRPVNVVDREFFWDDENNAIALGYGSIYNHSADESNATYCIDHTNKRMLYIATKPIGVGEEILIDYGYDWLAARGYVRDVMQDKKNQNASIKIMGVFVFLLMLSKIFPTHMMG